MVKDKNKSYYLYNISLVSGDTEINVVINAIAVISYISVIINRGTKDQIASISLTIEKEREFQKNIYFCFIDYTKALDCVDHNKLWKILQEMGIPDQLSCLLRNLNAGQEATVRTGNGTMDWLQIRKGIHQGCILSPCLYNFYAEYSCEMPGWMKHKLESRMPGEISISSDMQMTPPLWQKGRGTTEPLDESERGE